MGWRWVVFAALAAVLPGATTLRAADSNADFLAALREAGWNDTAVAYLDWVESSPLVTAEFREQIPYERAMSLAAQARETRNRDDRQRLLGEAAESFARFANGDPEAPATANAQWQAANLSAELALTTLGQANAASGAARDEGRAAALKQFDQASSAASNVLEACKARIAKLPKPTVAMADPEIRAERDELLNRQVEAEYLLALMTFERSGAFDTDAPERAEALEEAWTQFGALVEQYREKLVGASSRFYQGRVAQEQGEYAKALGCYEDLIEKPTTQEVFRRWTARAQRRRAECLIAQDKLDEAIRGCEQWLEGSRPAEREQPEWLEVTYQLALASRAKLKELPDNKSGGGRLESRLREMFRAVAERPNDFQQDARLALASLARGAQGSADYDTFDEALAAGKSAWELMTSSLMAAKVARENNPEGVAELERDAAANKEGAQRAFVAALELANEKTSVAELNAARYYLAWLYWEAGRLEEAAVLGEFLATRYGDGEYGPGSAKIALAAWEKLYQQARTTGEAGGAGGAFAAGKLGELAQLIATRWPDAPEASSAVSILISIALRENRVAEAQTLLAKLPAGARAGAELSLGSALWTQYLAATKDKPANTPFDEAALALRKQARDLLTSGFAAARSQPNPSTSTAVGGLYLVQLLLTENNGPAALDALEDKNAGPLAVISAEGEAAERSEFVLETYKAALRTYLTLEPPNRERAKAMMESLDAFVAKSGGADVAEQLTRVYVAVGLQLQRQIKDLTAAGDHMHAQQAAAAFGDVLDRVAARPNAGDWSIRNWIAQTNLEIGLGLKGDEATKYLKRSRDAYQAILAATEKREAGAPQGDAILGIRKRLGDCLVALGDYQWGVEQYAKFLEARPQTLDVQVAAANALLVWGAKGRSPQALNEAVQGSRPQAGGRNLVWGWNRLSQAAEGARTRAAAEAGTDPTKKAEAQRFEDLFYEARYNIARARYFGGVIAATPEARKNQLEAAQQHISQMKSLYPDLGGPKWKAAFDALLAQVAAELKKG